MWVVLVCPVNHYLTVAKARPIVSFRKEKVVTMDSLL